MTGPESRLQRRIRKAIRLKYRRGAKFFKIHGNEYQEAGIPDLIGCVLGLFFGFEVKVPGKEPDPIQRVRLMEIRRAGGIGERVTSSQEALKFIEKGLEKWEKKMRIPWQQDSISQSRSTHRA